MKKIIRCPYVMRIPVLFVMVSLCLSTCSIELRELVVRVAANAARHHLSCRNRRVPSSERLSIDSISLIGAGPEPFENTAHG